MYARAVPSASPEPRRLSRRRLLQAGAGAALLAGTPAAWARRDDPRIAVIGAGLAGLRCAHVLWRHAGLRADVYEADTSHVGGRCWSLRGYLSDGLVGEHGGAFINSDQHAIRGLARELGLRLEFVGGGDLHRGVEAYWFDGLYTQAGLDADWAAVGAPAVDAVLAAAPWPQLFDRFTPEARRVDRLSVPEWLDEVGIGSTSRLGRLLQADSVSEYGGDPADQSALNVIYLLSDNTPRHLRALANYDERLHVVGGNDQLVQGMVDQLPAGAIRQGWELVALAANADRSHTLTFQVDAGTRQVDVDHVVLALPFSTLRLVDLARARLSARKLLAIDELGMGQNAKLHVQLQRATWPALGFAGSAYTDPTGFCVAWDDSVARGPHAAPAVLLGYPGGSTGRDVLTGAAHGPAPSRDVGWLLDQIEPIFPGTRAAYSGIAYEDHWSLDPWHRGSYSYWRVGQYTTIAGSEGLREGRIHFAGEHTDPGQQGFMEGAVRSGERTAREIRRLRGR
jgi:monoamine oxidase